MIIYICMYVCICFKTRRVINNWWCPRDVMVKAIDC